jgi:hypothetical protein
MAYDECGFSDMINYAKPPGVPLMSEQAVWVDQHLRAAGLRT